MSSSRITAVPPGYAEVRPGVFAKRAQRIADAGQALPATCKGGLQVAAKATPEKALQSACESLLRRSGVRRYLHLSPMAREAIGWPDLVFVHYGTAFAVELKRPGKLPRPSQMECLSEMHADGWHCAVVQTYEEMQELLAGKVVGAARLRWQSALVEWQQGGAQ